MRPAGSRGLRRDVVAAATAYAVITLVLFRDLLPAISTHVYADPGDPLLNTAILLWNAKVRPLTRAWWDFPSFAPLAGVTAWTEHLLGAYPLTSPIIWITGNAVLAYNVLEMACFLLNGVCTFLLVREITQSSVGAFVGGLAFAFAPYTGENASHIQMLMAFGMPFALYSLHRYLRTPTWAALACFGIGWLSALLSSAYMLVFFPVLVALWCVWFLRGESWKTWTAIGVTVVVASLPVIPVLLGYVARQTAYGFSRPYAESIAMSAGIRGLAGISHRAVLWKGLLPDTFYEGSLFPGACISALAALALLAHVRDRQRRDTVIFYGASALVLWLFTLGPEPAWSAETSSHAYGPFWLLQQLPGGQSIRVPARAWLLATLCLAVCAGAGGAWVAARVRASWIVVPLALAIVGEGWFVDQISAVPTPFRAATIPRNAVVLDLPLYPGFENAGPQYLAVMSGYRSVNGYSGYAAPHFAPVRQALADHRPEALDAFRKRGHLYVIVRSVVDRPFLEWLEGQDGIELMAVDEGARLYRLPRLGPGPGISPLAPLPRPGQIVFSLP